MLGSCAPSRTRRLVSSIATEGPPAISVASSLTRSRRASFATTSFTSPIASASSADTMRPVHIICSACADPISRGRSHVAPMSGTSARFTKMELKRADSAAMRMSQASATESPAPTATPFTAAIVGLVQR